MLDGDWSSDVCSSDLGERDRSCPPDHQQHLADAVKGPVEMHIIPGAGHTYNPHQAEVGRLASTWLQKLG
jgi:dipeptidyl aminopeptidase/acylaminoacyl peptidase